MRIALISCAKQKRDGWHEAKDLYTSTRFKLAWEYASKNYDSVYILSAKHGLLSPRKQIHSYDATLNGMSVSDRKKWSRKVARQIDKEILRGARIDLFCAKRYREFLIPLVKDRTINVPLEGMNRGEQMRWFATEAKKPVLKFILHHDDPPCEERLNDRGDCPTCNLYPDMQSTRFHSYCPTCGVQLEKLKCPKCQVSYRRPS